MEEKKNISKSDTYDEANVTQEVIMEIPISVINDFPNHPYKVKDDDGMNELVESIKTRGLIQPILVRPIEEGKYEMVSGHRRKRAFEIAGIGLFLAIICNIYFSYKSKTKGRAFPLVPYLSVGFMAMYFI